MFPRGPVEGTETCPGSPDCIPTGPSKWRFTLVQLFHCNYRRKRAYLSHTEHFYSRITVSLDHPEPVTQQRPSTASAAERPRASRMTSERPATRCGRGHVSDESEGFWNTQKLDMWGDLPQVVPCKPGLSRIDVLVIAQCAYIPRVAIRVSATGRLSAIYVVITAESMIGRWPRFVWNSSASGAMKQESWRCPSRCS